jgi:hypothetical protein
MRSTRLGEIGITSHNLDAPCYLDYLTSLRNKWYGARAIPLSVAHSLSQDEPRYPVLACVALFMFIANFICVSGGVGV